LENNKTTARPLLKSLPFRGFSPAQALSYGIGLMMLFLYACANVVTPTGGSKDTTPPKIIRTEPANYTTNYHGESIKLFFNEFVQVKEEGKNLLISPSFKTRPEIKLKGKSVILSFQDSLRSNTTYNFNFGIALQDITEGNPLTNYQFLFSTGESIDSMEIHGIVRDAFTLVPVKDAMVMLYERDEDSLPFKVVPLYLTKTNETGSYSLPFIGKGPYKAIVLLDKNANYMFDGTEEDIGFPDQMILPEGVVKIMQSDKGKDSVVVVKEGSSLDFLTFKDASDSVQRVAKPGLAKPSQLVLTFRFPLKAPYISAFVKSAPLQRDWAMEEWNKRGDTVSLWFDNKLVKDSLTLVIADGAKILDTLNMDVMNLSKNARTKKAEPADAKAAYTTNTSSQFGLRQDFSVTFAYPLKEYDFSKVIFVQNKDTLPVRPYFTDSLKRTLRITKKWAESTPYSLYIPAGAITNMLGQMNDTLRFSWKTKSLKDYGDLTLSLSPKEKGHYLVQLYNSKDLMVRQFAIEDKAVLLFDYLDPGMYKLKLVFDKNNNGRWDSGHYLRKNQPEQIVWFRNNIEVRGNWQLEEVWELP